MRNVLTKFILITVAILSMYPTLFGLNVVQASIKEVPITDDTELKVVQGIPIISKKYPTPKGYEPKDLKMFANVDFGVSSEGTAGDRYASIMYGDKKALSKLEKLIQDANKVSGHKELYVTSAYRDFKYQESVFNNKVDEVGEDEATKVVSRAGYSEHLSGLAFDVTTKEHASLTRAFGSTTEGKWLADNAHKYGFIIRYENGKENITGYDYEPWHIRFIGEDKAKEYHEGGYTTLEVFLGLDDDEDGNSENGGNESSGDSGSSGGSSEGSDRKPFEPFKDDYEVAKKTGVDDGTLEIPTTIVYGFSNFTKDVFNILGILTQIFIAFMIILLALQVSVLAYRVRVGESNSAKIQKTIDLFTGKIPEERLKLRILINMLVITLVATIVYTRLHVNLFGAFYSVLEDILSVF